MRASERTGGEVLQTLATLLSGHTTTPPRRLPTRALPRPVSRAAVGEAASTPRLVLALRLLWERPTLWRSPPAARTSSFADAEAMR